jgi:hypothetical protein
MKTAQHRRDSPIQIGGLQRARYHGLAGIAHCGSRK